MNGDITPQDLLNDKIQTIQQKTRDDIEAISQRLHKLEVAVARLEAIHKD